jgi:hypothetical protein
MEGQTNTQTNPLAVVSMVLSLSSVLIGPLGFLPGIVCGHLALSRLRREREAGGAAATATGLAAGYGFLSLLLTSGVIAGVFALTPIKPAVAPTPVQPKAEREWVTVRTATARPVQPPRSASAQPPRTAPPPRAAVTPRTIANANVVGKVRGLDFTFNRAAFDKTLRLRGSEKSGSSTCDLVLFLFVDNMQKLAGKSWDSSKEASGPMPQVQVHFRADKNQPAATHGYATGYELKLEFGEERDGKIQGQISLKLPEPDDVTVTGPFTLDSVKLKPPSAESPDANR